MAYAHLGGNSTVPTSAISITALLSLGVGSPAKGRGFHVLSLLVPATNAARVYIGKDNTLTNAGANATGFLGATGTNPFSYTIDLSMGYGNTDNVFVAGNGADTIYVDIWE